MYLCIWDNAVQKGQEVNWVFCEYMIQKLLFVIAKMIIFEQQFHIVKFTFHSSLCSRHSLHWKVLSKESKLKHSSFPKLYALISNQQVIVVNYLLSI